MTLAEIPGYCVCPNAPISGDEPIEPSVIPGIATPADAPHAGGGFDDLTMESTVIPPESPLAGRTLLELDLIRRVGVQIGAIRGPTRRLISPSGGDRLEAGDELLVLGTHAQISEFNALLAPPGEAADSTQDRAGDPQV